MEIDDFKKAMRKKEDLESDKLLENYSKLKDKKKKDKKECVK